MKKVLYQISLILMIMIIGMISVFITKVSADSIAGLNCPSSTTIGSNFTVSLILPGNAYSAQANITVKFSDGTTSTQSLVYLNGMGDFPNSVSFNAKVAGNTTVTASNIVISDANANTVESGGSKSASINIASNSVAPTVENPVSNNEQPQITFSDINETVYTSDRCNVRKSYSTNSEKITTLEKGTILKRTGIASNGWSRVVYNGTTVYISSQYLTTTPVEIKFQEVNETVYATQECNLRKSWSTASDKVGFLTQGQEITRTGIADNGWSRVNYNGQVVYIATRLLTTEKTEETSEEELTDDTDIEKTEEEILSEIQEEIGILPEVGNNIATVLYIIMTTIAICGITIGVYYIKK